MTGRWAANGFHGTEVMEYRCSECGKGSALPVVPDVGGDEVRAKLSAVGFVAIPVTENLGRVVCGKCGERYLKAPQDGPVNPVTSN